MSPILQLRVKEGVFACFQVFLQAIFVCISGTILKSMLFHFDPLFAS